MARIRIPTIQECLKLHRSMHTPIDVTNHCKVVARGALALAIEINNIPELVSQIGRVHPELAHRTGLLHDLLKVQRRGWEIGTTDERVVSKLLNARGYNKLSKIKTIASPKVIQVREKYDFAQQPSARTVLRYTDSRFHGTRLISLTERKATAIRGDSSRTKNKKGAKFYERAFVPMHEFEKLLNENGIKVNEVLAQVK